MKIISPLYDKAFEYLIQLKAEEEIDTIFDTQEAKYLKQIEEEKLQKEEERKQKEEERRKKEEAIGLLKKLAISMHEKGVSHSDIAKILEKEETEVQKLLGL